MSDIFKKIRGMIKRAMNYKAGGIKSWFKKLLVERYYPASLMQGCNKISKGWLVFMVKWSKGTELLFNCELWLCHT